MPQPTELDPEERQLADRLNDVAIPMRWVGADGTILWANRGELALLGYRLEEYVGRKLHDFSVDPGLVDEMLNRAKAGETLRGFPAMLRAKDGSFRKVLIDSNAYFRDGVFLHTHCFTRDVTELSRALQSTEAGFRLLMEHAPVGIFFTDPDGDCQFVNARWRTLAGLSHAEAHGKGWARALHPDDRDRVFAEWYDAASHQREFVGEYRFQTPSGEVTWLQGRALPLRDASGEVEGYLGSITDITARKLADDIRQQAREAAERGTESMARLQALTAALATAVNLERIAQIVVDQGVSAVGATTGMLYLVDADGKHASLQRARGYHEDALETYRRVPVDGDTVLGNALRSRQPIYLESREDYATRYPGSEARTREHTEAVLALACLPLVADHQPLGAVTLTFSGERHFESSERSFLELLAYHCVQAVERTRLLEAERRSRREAENHAQRLGVLARASHSLSAAQLDTNYLFEAIAENVLSSFADSCSVLVVNDEGTHLAPAILRMRNAEAQRDALAVLDQTPVPLGVTTPGIVAMTGKPILVPVVDQAALLAGSKREYREHLQRYPIHSLLVVPIRARGSVIGVMVATRHTPDCPFSDDDQSLASDLADRAALGMAQARAFESERRTRERLTRLHALIGPLTSAKTREDVARLTVAEGREATGAASGLLYARDADGYLRLLWQVGVPSEFLRDLSVIPPDSNLPGALVARIADAIWIENIEEYGEAFPELAERVKVAGRAPAFAAVPLIAENQCLGVLAFGHMRAHRFMEEERAFLWMLAHHCAHALYRARLLQQAEDAARRAEEASRLKDEFLATVSHELRTPLSAILGWSAILHSKRGTDPNVVAKAAAVIERNGQAQLRIIEDMLDVSSIIRGQLRIEQDPVDLGAIAIDVLDSLRPSANAKQLTIVEDIQRPCCVLGDADRMRQILWNLLSNSVKFTPLGGEVRLEMRYDGQRVAITVRDTGSGIAPEFLPHVFDRFRQQEGGMARTHGGLGLGLAIVRHLTEMHGGTVVAESPGIGKGAKFTVLLPVRPFMASTSLPAPATALAELRVLVVEDDPDARELIKVLLSSEGAKVRVAAAADEALGTLRAFHPDVVVSDIAMPGHDGYFLVGALKRMHPNLPVVALTAFGSRSDVERARDAGFDHYFVKPLDPSRLVDVLARYRQ